MFLPVDKLEAEPFLRSFLSLQGAYQLPPQPWQVLLVHLPSKVGQDRKWWGEPECQVPAHLPLVVGLRLLFDVGVELRDVRHVRVGLSTV